MENTFYKKYAEDVSRFLNDFSFNPKKFCDAMNMEHRTLQQSFTKLCAAWIYHCASDEYATDGRNEASHEVARRMVKDFAGENPADYLPMV